MNSNVPIPVGCVVTFRGNIPDPDVIQDSKRLKCLGQIGIIIDISYHNDMWYYINVENCTYYVGSYDIHEIISFPDSLSQHQYLLDIISYDRR